MAPTDAAKWAPKAKRAAKTSLDLCRGLADIGSPAFDAVNTLELALSQDQDPTDVLKVALQTVEAIAKSSRTSAKSDAIRRKVQPLTWACKDFAKLFKDIDDIANFGACHLTLAQIARCNIEEPNAPNLMLKAAQEAIKVFKDIGDVAGEASAHQVCVDAHMIKGALSPFKEVQAEESSLALEAAQTQLKLSLSVNDPRGESQALKNLAQVYLSDARDGDKDDLMRADEAAAKSFQIAKNLGEQDLEIATLRTLMGARLHTEGAHEVERLCDEASRRWRRSSPGMRQNDQAWLQKTTADALLHMGESADALAKARECLDMYEKTGDQAGQADALMTVFTCLSAQGSTVEAKETLNEAIAMFRQVGDKHSEALALCQAMEPMISDLKLPVLADCFFSRDLQELSYNVQDADLYRRGDEAMRFAKRAVTLLAETGDQDGQLRVDAVIQDAIERAVQAHVKSKPALQEKIKVDAVNPKKTTRVGVWLVQLPRMLSVAQSDEEKARCILRLERDPPSRGPGKMKVPSKQIADKESDSDDDDDDDEEDDDDDDEEQPLAIAAASGTTTKAAAYTGPSLDDLKELVKSVALDLIGNDDLDFETPLMDAGLDSLAAVEFAGILVKQNQGLSLPSTMMFDYPNASSIAELIDSERRSAAGF
jgi:tetratricopeptide (TPR) repeat protein